MISNKSLDANLLRKYFVYLHFSTSLFPYNTKPFKHMFVLCFLNIHLRTVQEISYSEKPNKPFNVFVSAT